jgi:hypothetical protein
MSELVLKRDWSYGRLRALSFKHSPSKQLITAAGTLLAALSLAAGSAAGQSPRISDLSLAASGDVPAELSGTFQLGGDPVYGPAGGSPTSPTISFDGTNYLAAWEDWSDIDQGEGAWIIMGSRLTPSGAALDTFRISISARPVVQIRPAAAFDGSNYFVVWQETSRWYSDDWAIYGARVTPDGAVLDPDGIRITADAADRSYPRLACGRENCLLAWIERRNSLVYGVYGARVGPDGAVLDGDPIEISDSADPDSPPAVAFDGENYMVIWSAGGGGRGLDITGRRISEAGDLLDNPSIIISEKNGHQKRPALAFHGTDYLVAWLDATGGDGAGYEIYGTRVSPEGTVFDTNGVPISTGLRLRHSLSIAAGETNYAVIWDERSVADTLQYVLNALRVAPSGAVLDADPLTVDIGNYFETDQAVAFDGADFTVIWRRLLEYSGQAIWSKRLPPSGPISDLEGTAVTIGANSQYSPDAAFDGEGYMAVWADGRASGLQVYGTRITSSGVILDPGGIEVSRGTDWASTPSIAFDGAGYMVAFEGPEGKPNYTDTYLSRVSMNGEVLDEAPIVLSTPDTWQREPLIASDGANYMVIWTDVRPGSYENHYATLATRVSPSGEVLDPDVIHVPVGGSDCEVVFGGSNYLVVADGVRAARISPTGEVLDPDGLDISAALHGPYGRFPAAAFDGMNFMIVWDENRNGSYDIFGARMDPSGTVIDAESIPIATSDADEAYPSVVFDGTYYVVLWLDQLNNGREIYGARVTTSGIVVDPEGFRLPSPDGRKGPPVPVSAGPGRFLTLYSSFTAGPPFETYRIWGNLWSQVSHEPTALLSAAPNPFRSNVTLSFSIPSHAIVRLDLFDAMGRHLKTLADGYRGPGWHHETWDGTDEEGHAVPSGVYFARVQSKYGRAIRRCILAK